MPGLARILATAVLIAVAGRTAGASDFAVQGIGAGRGIAVASREAWISGGFGRLGEGRDVHDFAWLGRGEAQLGIEWTPSAVVLVRAHATARTEPDAAGGARAGLTEAFLQYRPELRPDLALRFRGGLMFLPTSRENVDPLWQSPYTLTLSALNTWIGEELRPVGLNAALQLGEAGGSRFELAGMAFGGSDTAGALLSWRGWAMGTRLSVVGETLPLPPLPTLAPGGAFGEQQRAGTQPIDELDDRLGWHVRFRLVAEGLAGETGMGLVTGAHVDLDIRAAYALLTWEGDGLRVTARYDRFRNEDRDGVAEPNQESGWAATTAAFYAPRPWLRFGVEYLELRGDRPAAAFAGTEPEAGARRAQAELRLRF